MIDHQTVLALIKAALEDMPADIPADFQQDEYLTFAKSQQIEALIIVGLRKSGVPVSKEVRNRLLASAMVSTKQLAAEKLLCEAFQNHAIDYMPLKGCVMKHLYPSDALRSMGDLDILVRVEQYARIRPLMLSLGFREGVESDHEHVWDRDQIHVELHKRLIPSYNKDYYAYYGEGWQLAKPSAAPFCYEMTPEDTFIYLFTHYAKHYRDAGVGIRQALDLYVYRKAYPDMDEGYVLDKMKLLQLERFYANTMHMLDVWFRGAEHTEASQLISDRLFFGSVFGKRENSLQATMLKQVNRCGSVKEVKLLNWFKRAFPPYKGMCQLYPVLKNCPLLLPIMWAVRWGNILLHKRRRFKEYMAEDSTLTEESVKEYREMLHKSGLDFNFK